MAGPVCVLSHFCYVQLFVTLWTVNCWAPLSMRFSRQEYWSEQPFPPLASLPDPGMEPTSLPSPALAGRFFTASATWEALAEPEFQPFLINHLWYDDWRGSWIPGRKEPTTPEQLYAERGFIHLFCQNRGREIPRHIKDYVHRIRADINNPRLTVSSYILLEQGLRGVRLVNGFLAKVCFKVESLVF